MKLSEFRQHGSLHFLIYEIPNELPLGNQWTHGVDSFQYSSFQITNNAFGWLVGKEDESTIYLLDWRLDYEVISEGIKDLLMLLLVSEQW